VLGASNYTYAEAFPSQHWTAGHVHAFEFFGGCTQILVSDNLRAGVTRAMATSRSERHLPGDGRSLFGGCHPGQGAEATRQGESRDRGAGGGALDLGQPAQPPLSLAGRAQSAIRERLGWLNRRPFKKLEGCRLSLFEELERPVLRPLPSQRYDFAIWKTATVNIDYHVEVDRHYYSVPYQLAGQRCDVRLTTHAVEVILRGRRVASHRRSFVRGRHATDPAHMPEAHRRHLEWTPSRIIRVGGYKGPGHRPAGTTPR
jgi:transposase